MVLVFSISVIYFCPVGLWKIQEADFCLTACRVVPKFINEILIQIFCKQKTEATTKEQFFFKYLFLNNVYLGRKLNISHLDGCVKGNLIPLLKIQPELVFLIVIIDRYTLWLINYLLRLPFRDQNLIFLMLSTVSN